MFMQKILKKFTKNKNILKFNICNYYFMIICLSVTYSSLKKQLCDKKKQSQDYIFNNNFYIKLKYILNLIVITIVITYFI